MDTLKEHQARRGRVRVPDPHVLNMFSAEALPHARRATPLASGSGSATSAHSRLRPEAVNSRQSSRAVSASHSAASDTDWYSVTGSVATGISDQRTGPDRQPQATRRRRRRRDELGNHNASTLPVLADYEQKSIDDMQALVKLKLLVENGFPEIAQKKEWANQAYGEAYVAAGFRKSLFEK